ncbi:MAG: translocation/assembly module TamB domain-containing protein, partial [Candidatus Thiodiazotropha sp.]
MKPRLKRISLYLGGLLGLLLILLIAGLLYLGSSQDGARRLFQLAQTWLPGELSYRSIEGRLAGPLVVDGLSYQQADGLLFETETLRFDWRPSALLKGGLHILEFTLRGTTVALPKSESETSSSEPFQGVALPLGISIDHFASENFQLIPGPNQDPITINQVEFKAVAEGDQLLVSMFSVEAFSAGLKINGEAGLVGSLPLVFNLEWYYQLPDGPGLSGQGKISGDLQKLHVQQTLAPPISGSLNASLFKLLESPTWEAVLALDEAQLSEFSSEFPASLKGRLSARGGIDNARIESQLKLKEPSLGELSSELIANYSGGKLKVESLEITNPQALKMVGKAEYQLQEEDLSAEVTWQSLRWPLSGKSKEFSSEQGEVRLQGHLDDYTYSLTTDMGRAEFPDIQLSASGTGNLQGLKFEQLVLAQQQGKIEGSGEVGWSPAIEWRMDLNGKQINPGLLQPEFPGELAFHLTSDGILLDGKPELKVRLDDLSGELRDYPLQANGQLKYQQGVVDLQALDLHAGPNLIQAEGKLGDRLALDWSANLPELASLWPGLSGALNGAGKLKGTPDKPQIEGKLSGKALAYQSFGMETVEGQVGIDMDDAQPIAISLKAGGLSYEGKRWDNFQADVSGTLPKHQISIALQGIQVPQLSLKAQAGLDRSNNWLGQLQQLLFASPEIGKWQLAQPVDYQIGSLSQQLEHFCLVSGKSQACGSYTGQIDKRWNAELQITDLDLKRLQAWLAGVTQLTGRLVLQAELSSKAPGQLEAKIEGEVPNGELKFSISGVEQRIVFSKSDMIATLDSTGVEAKINLPLQRLGGFKGAISLPGFKLDSADFGKQKMKGQINGGIKELSIVSLLAPQFKNSHGELSINFDLGGELASPQLKGKARLNNGAFDIPDLGVELSEMSLTISAPELDQLTVSGTVHSGDGKLSLQGTTRLDAEQGFPSKYQIKGKNWLAVDLPEAEVQISPNLTFTQDAKKRELIGELHVPYARLRPRELPQSAVSASKDVVVTGGENQQSKQNDIPVYAKIRLSLGKRVSFDGFGLRGNFIGNLLLIEEPGRPVIGRGRLGITDGVYQAYGQDLKIERGYVLFADNPVENPGLDVRAVREVGDVTAGLRVNGTLKTPKLTLFSTPAMGESDVLTYLLTGRPPGESSGETVGVVAALKASGAGSVATELGRRLGLEELRVDTGSNLEEASLVAGTYLSPRLYVQYINELSTAETKLRMRYDLTDRWQLEAETGSNQSG